jgi:hypothetical protein
MKNVKKIVNKIESYGKTPRGKTDKAAWLIVSGLQGKALVSL